jgi:hypothetical protein
VAAGRPAGAARFAPLWVAGSSRSAPAIAPRIAAASATVRAIGPAVSWLCAIGTIPLRLTRPRVGLMPTRPLVFDGDTIDPSVSVPIAAALRFAAIAAPEPELEPDGLRSSAYGFFVCPPRPLQPLVECVDRKFAHSLRLVLPRMTAPAARSRSTMNASFGGLAPASAREPAVVIIRSAVAMLSLINTGMPCSTLRGPRSLRSASRRSAIASASGFSSITLWRAGPLRSMASIRATYCSASDRAVSRPDCIRCWRSAMVASSSANWTGAGAGG